MTWNAQSRGSGHTVKSPLSSLFLQILLRRSLARPENYSFEAWAALALEVSEVCGRLILCHSETIPQVLGNPEGLISSALIPVIRGRVLPEQPWHRRSIG